MFHFVGASRICAFSGGSRAATRGSRRPAGALRSGRGAPQRAVTDFHVRQGVRVASLQLNQSIRWVGGVASVALAASSASEVRAQGELEAYDLKGGQIFVAAKTGIYDITEGGDFEGKKPFYDAAEHGLDGVEGLCFDRRLSLFPHMFVTNNRKVVVNGKDEFHGEVVRVTLFAGGFHITEVWATGFETVAGLYCSDTGVYMAEVVPGRIWDVSKKGDYSDAIPIAIGLDTPFDVIKVPGAWVPSPLGVPWYRPSYLVSSGHDQVYGIYDYRSDSPYVKNYSGVGRFLTGLCLYDGPGSSQLPSLAVSDEGDLHVHGLPDVVFPKKGPWATLADMPGPPSALCAVGKTIYASVFTDSTVYAFNSRSGKVKRFAWGFPQFDIAEFDYVDVCGDGVPDYDREICDEGGETALCDVDCTPAHCGDGVLNVTAGEQCDDANDEDSDRCSPDCLLAGGDPPATHTGGCVVASPGRNMTETSWAWIAAALAAAGIARRRRGRTFPNR